MNKGLVGIKRIEDFLKDQWDDEFFKDEIKDIKKSLEILDVLKVCMVRYCPDGYALNIALMTDKAKKLIGDWYDDKNI